LPLYCASEEAFFTKFAGEPIKLPNGKKAKLQD
jgi:hypothetical protein